jgi:hypothetical protein
VLSASISAYPTRPLAVIISKLSVSAFPDESSVPTNQDVGSLVVVESEVELLCEADGKTAKDISRESTSKAARTCCILAARASDRSMATVAALNAKVTPGVIIPIITMATKNSSSVYPEFLRRFI